MSTIQLAWIGDLDAETRSASEHLRPRRIDIGSGQKETKFGRENTKNPPDYCLESSINNRMVSRKHATIERSSQGNFMLYDHSLNGTYVNYQRVSGAVHLKQGDVVCFGHLNGANIKAGESVAPYHSDLKYKVDVVEGKGAAPTAEKKKKPSAAKLSTSLKRDSRAFDDSSDSELENSKKAKQAKKLTTTKKAHRSSDSSPSLSSSSSSDSEPENATMKLENSVKKSKENGGKKSSSLLASSASAGRKPASKKPPRKSEPASSTSSSKKPPTGSSRGSKGSAGGGPVVGAALGGGGANSSGFHYENDECSATPCRRPEDLAIDWIQCDRCTKWYHQICVGMTADEEMDDSEQYYCPKCKK